jgi:hypothetical protein
VKNAKTERKTGRERRGRTRDNENPGAEGIMFLGPCTVGEQRNDAHYVPQFGHKLCTWGSGLAEDYKSPPYVYKSIDINKLCTSVFKLRNIFQNMIGGPEEYKSFSVVIARCKSSFLTRQLSVFFSLARKKGDQDHAFQF